MDRHPAGAEQGQSSRTALSLAFTRGTVFISDPHRGIAGIEDQSILNLVDGDAGDLQNHMVALTREKPGDLADVIRDSDLPDRHDVRKDDINMARLASVLDLAYNRDIEKFEDLVDLHGVGPRTLKALAMASEVILVIRHGSRTLHDLRCRRWKRRSVRIRSTQSRSMRQ